jgi:hypothetical protein
VSISKVQFIVFYSIFLIFLIWFSGEVGMNVLTGTSGLYELPTPTGAWWLDWTLPFSYFWAFLTISTLPEYTLLFTLILMPFIIGVVVIIAEMIRGN